MNQVKNTSLNEVHDNGHDCEDQVGRVSRVPRCRSIVINESAEGTSITKQGAVRLPGADRGIVAANKPDSNNGEVPVRRTRILTEKVESFRLTILKERRKKANERLLRKRSTIKDQIFSTRNMVAVEEELA